MITTKCTKCNEEFSILLESCPKCNQPNIEFEGVFYKPNNQSINYCPKCGSITHGHRNCIYCGHALINAGITYSEYKEKEQTNTLKAWESSILDNLRSKPEFSESEYQKRITSKETPYKDTVLTF